MKLQQNPAKEILIVNLDTVPFIGDGGAEKWKLGSAFLVG
jgi:hypothetical protein